MECDVLLDERRRCETKWKDRIPTVWFSLRRSLSCKSQPDEVRVPEARSNPRSFLASKLRGSGCPRSMDSFMNVIHGGKRRIEITPSCSPRSIGSSEFINPIAHEAIFNESRFNGFRHWEVPRTGTGSISPPAWKPSSRLDGVSNPARIGGGVHQGFSQRDSLSAINGCHKCGERFGKFEGLEAHHLSKHAVTELAEADSSKKVVEMICRTRGLNSQTSCLRIERILRVHCMQKTLAGFEEHRSIIKFKAGKLPTKHPRCLADGNELLRFHGTAVSCDLGAGGSRGLCASEKCGVCRIIRHGFSAEGELGAGVFMASTGAAALKSIEIRGGDGATKRALLICRVIAGRVHRPLPLENLHELGPVRPDFDSLAGKGGVYSSVEELYLLNPRALLPCFVVICKP